jgi:flagellar basal body-associated protein FliL
VLKLVLIGIWVAVVTALSSYFAAGFMSQPAVPDGTGEAQHKVLEQLSTEMTSVPMVRNGSVIGYVIIQLNFAIDKEAKDKSHVDPLPYLVDAAFRAVYQNPQADFAKLRASDIDKLTDAIKEEANQRLGHGMVDQVLIQQLNYVRREDIRTNWVKEGH